MDPLSVTCTALSPDGNNCAAQMDEQCRWTGWTGVEPPPKYHDERWALAESMDRNRSPITTPAMATAIDDSGLV